MKKICAILFTTCWSLMAVRAAEADKPAAGDKTNSPAAKSEALTFQLPDAKSKPVTNDYVVTIAGEKVEYTVETGMLPLLKPDGTPKASVFYMAYTRKGQGDRAKRPITFCFNGGPGSSSVWLHLGALGPRRVKLNDDGTLPKPPFQLVDNEYSILHVTDMVFIDPVATGYSRATKDEKPEQFFGQQGDIESVGEFIRFYATKQQRWRSPKYLCGESYGVFRAAGLAEYLHSRYGLYLNGLLLVSGLLDYATLREGPGNELPYLVFLPAYTATAHHHKKLPPDLQANLPAALAEARAFMKNEYPGALFQGNALPAENRRAVVQKLSRLTGLTPRVIEDNDLRVSPSVFRKMLLLDQNVIIGRFDARITGRDADRAANVPGFDPSYAATLGPFSAAMNAYVREELKFESDLPYEILTGVGPWNFSAPNSYPSVAERLGSVLSQNPHLRVLVQGGLTDLACPIDGIRYSIEHLQLDPAYRGNFTYAEYESGHMMYANLPDLKKFQKDLEQFLRN